MKRILFVAVAAVYLYLFMQVSKQVHGPVVQKLVTADPFKTLRELAKDAQHNQP